MQKKTGIILILLVVLMFAIASTAGAETVLLPVAGTPKPGTDAFSLAGAETTENETTTEDATVEEAVTATPELVSLSLEAAIKKAVTDNAQINLQQLAVDSATITKTQADDAAKELKRQEELYGIQTDQSGYMVKNIYPAQAREGLKLAQISQAYTINSIKYGVEAAYYGLQQTIKYEGVAELSLERAQSQWDTVKAKYKQGLAAKLDLLSAETNYNQARADFNQAAANTKLAQMSLAQLLGLDINTQIVPTSKFSYVETQMPDIAKTIEEELAKDVMVALAKFELSNAEILFDFQKKHWPEITYSYRQAQIDYQKAAVSYGTAEKNFVIAVNKAWLDLSTAKDNYTVLQGTEKLAKEAYRLTLLNYDAGLGTFTDVLSAAERLAQGEMAVLGALYNYNLAKAKFTYGIFN